MIEVRATGCPGGVSCVSGSIPAPVTGQQQASHERISRPILKRAISILW